MKIDYQNIVAHYEGCFAKHGDTHKGMDWPNQADAEKRYEIMLDIIRVHRNESKEISLLDFGCGTAHLYEYLLTRPRNGLEYRGLDISSVFIDLARNKHPAVTFYCGDVLNDSFQIPTSDYIVMNGVFTEKVNLSFDEMWEYFTNMLLHVFKICNRGIAFNVMSKNVDWERDDLFHVSLDKLTAFLCSRLTRNFVVRNDYGLYEYTVYVYKN